MIVYFDSSALIKLFLDEPDSQIALDIWNDADLIVTSQISYLEVYAGLARAMRENPSKLSKTGYDDAKAQFEQLWAEVSQLAYPRILFRMQATQPRDILCGRMTRCNLQLL